jgi:hypothetical protein
MLAPLEPGIRVVRLQQPLTDAEYERLAGVMAARPEVILGIPHRFGERGSHDLEFLRFFPWLSRLHVWAGSMHDLSGLRHLDRLRSLTVGTSARSRSLRPLAGLSSLQELHVEGPVSGVRVLSELTGMQDLTLRSVNMPDLSPLAPMTELASLDLKLGNTRDLSLLPGFTRLRYFEAWMIRGLADISVIGEVTTLEKLWLQDLKHVARLPPLGKLTRLRRIRLEGMRGLTDVGELMTAPALERLALLRMSAVDVGSVNQLQSHPTLREAAIHLGTAARTSAVTLSLPSAGRPSAESMPGR